MSSYRISPDFNTCLKNVTAICFVMWNCTIVKTLMANYEVNIEERVSTYIQWAGVNIMLLVFYTFICDVQKSASLTESNFLVKGKDI